MKVNNWDKWQTFRKDRGTPPWIKVHRSLMSNAEWVQLSDKDKGQLISIWMLAADKDGEIPDNPTLVMRMALLESTPDLNKFKELGFLADNNEADSSAQEDLEQDKAGKIYFIKLKNTVKIGFSKNPWARLSQLKCGMPYEPELICSVNGSMDEEKELHSLFEEYQINREWFDLKGDLKAFINKCKATGELPADYPRTTRGLPDDYPTHQSREEESREEESRKTTVSVVDHLNEKCGTKFKPIGANEDLILARLQEGYAKNDLIDVINSKVEEWGQDQKMKKFLRPKTLFGKEKFSQYVGLVGQSIEEDFSWAEPRCNENVIELGAANVSQG